MMLELLRIKWMLEMKYSAKCKIYRMCDLHSWISWKKIYVSIIVIIIIILKFILI